MRGVMTLAAGLAVGAGWATADPGPKGPAANVDPKLVGRWTLVRSFAGDTETTEDPARVEYEFTADGKWTLRRDGTEDPTTPGTLATDTTEPDARPNRIDFTFRDLSSPKESWVVGGIYKIDGDTLEFRTDTGGSRPSDSSVSRPRAFDDPAKGFRAVCKRVPKDGKPPRPAAKATVKVDPRLVGRWEPFQSFYGTTETTGRAPPSELEFTADGTQIIRHEGKEGPGGPTLFTTDTSATPRQIAFLRNPGHPLYHSIIQAIYKIERDTLTVLSPDRAQGRPTSFEEEKGYRVIYKRLTNVDAPAAPKAAPKPDPALIGRWKVDRSFNGETETTRSNADAEYEFTAEGKWVFRPKGKDSIFGPGTFTTDPKAAPAHIDLVYDLVDLKERMEVKGIYKLDGNTLTIRTGERDAARPMAFDGPGKGYRVVLKKLK